MEQQSTCGVRTGAARIAGFTLIELMIVVAVVAVLAAIALPAYNDAVRKGRRGQAKADLVELAQYAERFHSSNNTYVGFDAWVDKEAPTLKNSPRDGMARYTLAIVEAADTFSITATPTADGGQLKDKCGVLTLASSGEKKAEGGTAEECF